MIVLKNYIAQKVSYYCNYVKQTVTITLLRIMLQHNRGLNVIW